MKIFEIIENFPDMLYHATYKPYLRSIRTFGLKSDGANKNWEDSQDGVVYLARDPTVAISYAETSDIVPEEYLDEIIVLKIDTAKLDLNAIHHDANVIDGVDTFEYHGIIPWNAITILK